MVVSVLALYGLLGSMLGRDSELNNVVLSRCGTKISVTRSSWPSLANCTQCEVSVSGCGVDRKRFRTACTTRTAMDHVEYTMPVEVVSHATRQSDDETLQSANSGGRTRPNATAEQSIDRHSAWRHGNVSTALVLGGQTPHLHLVLLLLDQ